MLTAVGILEGERPLVIAVAEADAPAPSDLLVVLASAREFRQMLSHGGGEVDRPDSRRERHLLRGADGSSGCSHEQKQDPCECPLSLSHHCGKTPSSLQGYLTETPG
jgi:hypothetical protein